MTRPNQKAFSDTHLIHLRQNLRVMVDKHESFEPNPFTQDEMLQLFVKRDDHQAVRDAARLFGGHNLPYYVTHKHLSPQTVSAVLIQVSLIGNRTYGFPTYAGMCVDDAPDHLIMAFQSYCETRIAIAKEYALAYQTLTVLNETCTTASQVAFLWPCIRALAEDGNLRELLAKKPKTLPAVPPPLREACSMTAATITMNTMLGTPPATNHSIYVHLAGAARFIGPMGEYKTQ